FPAPSPTGVFSVVDSSQRQICLKVRGRLIFRVAAQIVFPANAADARVCSGAGEPEWKSPCRTKWVAVRVLIQEGNARRRTDAGGSLSPRSSPTFPAYPRSVRLPA